MPRTVLITGSNRGIGHEVARRLGGQGLAILAGVRDEATGTDTVARLAEAGVTARPAVVDTGSPESIDQLVRGLESEGITVDVLINNAGIYREGTLLGVGDSDLEDTLAVNFIGPLRLARALLPGMIARGYGRVVNVTSSLGSMAQGLQGAGSYSVSKACLNAVSLRLGQDVSGDVKVNSVDPGWVNTRMGGEQAPRDVGEGADTICWLATLPADGPSGGFFRDREPMDW